MDGENNKTTPAISFSRFHEDFDMVTKKASKGGLDGHKSSSYKRNKDRYGISDP